MAYSTKHPMDGINRAPEGKVDPNTQIEEGVLKFFNVKKGYGFIMTKSGDLFVHISAFQKAGIEVPERDTSLRFQRGISRDQRELALVLYP